MGTKIYPRRVIIIKAVILKKYMSRRYDPAERTVINAAALTAEFTAATSDIITSNTHGLVSGDVVTVSNSGGALPGGLSASTYYWVVKIDADTFYLATSENATSYVNITNTGSGTHTFIREQVTKGINVSDYRHVTVQIDSAASTTAGIKSMGSVTYTYPDFSQAQSTSNNYDYVGMIDLQNATGIDGDTGLSFSNSEDHRLLSINTDGLTSISFKTSGFSAGTLVVKVRGFN